MDMKILLAIDESEFSQAAIQEVDERLAAHDATVRVLHVVGSFIPPAAAVLDAGGSLEGVREDVASRYQALVDEAAERLKARGLSAEGVVKDGSPGKVIVEDAKVWGADLIVVGSHGRGGLGRLLMGSVAQYVVDHAQCSVEVVHRKER
jgi:nucleotide-binding universal stress UspA family protein